METLCYATTEISGVKCTTKEESAVLRHDIINKSVQHLNSDVVPPEPKIDNVVKTKVVSSESSNDKCIKFKNEIVETFENSSSNQDDVIKSDHIFNKDDLQQMLHEWLDTDINQSKSKLIGDKLEKIALKLKKPEEEDKLRIKIEKFLEKTRRGDFYLDEEIEFRQQLANYIINTLRNKYLKKTSQCSEVSRVQVPQYYSKVKINNLRKEVSDWLGHLKNNALYKASDDEDVNQIVEKLESLVLDRPKNNTKYKIVLTSAIKDIVNDLQIDICTKNKNIYLKKIIDNLVSNILNIEDKIPINYIQPTVTELKEFVKNQITFLLEKARTAISTKRIEYLETGITNRLLDISDDDDDITDDISDVFTLVAKLDEEKAKYFANIIVNDYKHFYFRYHHFKNKEENYVSDTSMLCNLSTIPDEINNEEKYKKLLEKVVDTWLTNVNLQTKDDIKDLAIKNITSDIIYRLKYLHRNGNFKKLDDVEHLKYQLFKRTNEWAENYIVTTEDTKALMKSINEIPIPMAFVGNGVSKTQINKSEETKLSFKKEFRELFINDYVVEKETFDKEFIKNLAENITKSINNNDLETVETKIDEWAITMFDRILNNTDILNINDGVKSTLYYNYDNVKKRDLKQDNIIVRKYEDIIDEWLDNMTLKLNEKTFFNKRNELIHELAVKIRNTKLNMQNLIISDINEKLRNNILDAIKKVPLSTHCNKKTINYYADYLVDKIQTCSIEDLNIPTDEETKHEILSRIQNISFNGLSKPHLVKNKKDIKEKYDSIVKKLEDILSKTNDQENVDDKIIDNLIMLSIIDNIAVQMKQYLRDANNLPHVDTEEAILEAKVEAWLSGLPLYVKDTKHFETEKKKIIQKLKETDIVKIVKDIVKIMKTLPIELSMKLNDMYLNRKAYNLLESLKEKKETPIINHDVIHAIGDAIQNYAKLLRTKDDEEIHKQQRETQNYSPHIKVKRGLKGVQFNENKSIVNEDNNVMDGINEFTRDNLNNLIQSITNVNDIYSNSKAYTQLIVNQINEWLHDYNLLQSEDEDFRKVLIYALADDIAERHKYLRLNPEPKNAGDDELNYLKYQIHKWVNKLTSDHNLDTAPFANELVKRVTSIPPPVFTVQVTGEDANQLPRYETFRGTDGLNKERRRHSRTHNCPVQIKSEISNHSSPKLEEHEENPKAALFKQYETIFKNKINELPIDTSTPDDARLAELARIGLYNGIIKTFFRLKSDPDIANDHDYFELLLEEKLDDMLDILPQTDKMKSIRQSWKICILSSAMSMLQELQELTDRPSFRQRLKDGFLRKFARKFDLEVCYLLQQGFLNEMADAYILETKYNEENPLKANIYKQRLMKKVDELVNHLTEEHDTQFRFFNKAQLAQEAMKVLDSVPIPKNDILDEEVDEILLAEEIEKWYKELPTSPYLNDFDQVFRKRMIELLAKKLHDIENNTHELDTTKERQMKHEISKFLGERGKLMKDEDLNINFMVDELNNRIKNRKFKDSKEYAEFEKNKPACSTFAKLDTTEILAPLVEAPVATEPYSKRASYIPFTADVDSSVDYNSKPGPSLPGRIRCQCPFNSTANFSTPQSDLPYQCGTSVAQNRPFPSPAQHQASHRIPCASRLAAESMNSTPRQGEAHSSRAVSQRVNLAPYENKSSSDSYKPYRSTLQSDIIDTKVNSISQTPCTASFTPQFKSRVPIYIPTDNGEINQGGRQGLFNPLSTSYLNPDMVQDDSLEARQACQRFNNRPNGSRRVEFSGTCQERIGGSNEEDGEKEDKIGLKCRCFRRLYRRRCLDSFPCPRLN